MGEETNGLNHIRLLYALSMFSQDTEASEKITKLIINTRFSNNVSQMSPMYPTIKP